jgi:hypothetical protein
MDLSNTAKSSFRLAVYASEEIEEKIDLMIKFSGSE